MCMHFQPWFAVFSLNKYLHSALHIISIDHMHDYTKVFANITVYGRVLRDGCFQLCNAELFLTH